jgi:hypothetical protein
VKRESISKRTRFEIFKRDAFMCQYCGAGAPDAVLHIEHIIPVSRGGTSHISNLTTACQKCNSGKSDVPLEVVIKSPDLHIDEYRPAPVKAIPANFGPEPLIVRRNLRREARTLSALEDAASEAFNEYCLDGEPARFSDLAILDSYYADMDQSDWEDHYLS